MRSLQELRGARAPFGRELRRRKRAAAQEAQHEVEAGNQEEERSGPEEERRRLERRPVEQEVAVALDHEVDDLALGLAGGELLADLVAQVDRERRVRFGERLVLAHEAAQLVREVRHAAIELPILRRGAAEPQGDRKSTRLNSSHVALSRITSS